MSAVSAGLDAGLTEEEIVGHADRRDADRRRRAVVSAAPNLALALGYDIAEAFEAVAGDPWQ